MSAPTLTPGNRVRLVRQVEFLPEWTLGTVQERQFDPDRVSVMFDTGTVGVGHGVGYSVDPADIEPVPFDRVVSMLARMIVSSANVTDAKPLWATARSCGILERVRDDVMRLSNPHTTSARDLQICLADRRTAEVALARIESGEWDDQAVSDAVKQAGS